VISGYSEERLDGAEAENLQLAEFFNQRLAVRARENRLSPFSTMIPASCPMGPRVFSSPSRRKVCRRQFLYEFFVHTLLQAGETVSFVLWTVGADFPAGASASIFAAVVLTLARSPMLSSSFHYLFPDMRRISFLKH